MATKHAAVFRSSAARVRRQRRTRVRLRGSAARPRLSVFRSLRFTSAQLINDAAGTTLWAASTRGIASPLTKVEAARKLGAQAAQAALARGIARVVFDRGPYRYHGRVQAVADGARSGGLQI